MHKYLRAIGFSKYIRNRDIRVLLSSVQEGADSVLALGDEQEKYELYDLPVADGMGIRLFGGYDEEGRWQEQYYFPYTETDRISTKENCSVERHSDRVAFGGIVDDPVLGVSLIFYLSNGVEYIYHQRKSRIPFPVKGVSLNALSISGKIILPVYKTEQEKEKGKAVAKTRGSLLQAAKNGDENAMESLAIEDMNIFQNVSSRIIQEDLYTIVDTSFMPFGLESDQYAVIGEILEMEKIRNRLTGEVCWRLWLECNSVFLTVTINEQDLLGEPAVGRRFKGDIWLQGKILYSDLNKGTGLQ